MSPLVVGNWKMNLSMEAARDLVASLVEILDKGLRSTAATIVVCPSFPHLSLVGHRLLGTPIMLGAQDCSLAKSGAFTGDVSAEMLKDVGCQYVILGHSERRQRGETSAQVQEKMARAHEAGLTVILCVGETATEKAQGRTLEILKTQLKESRAPSTTANNTVIAYEPIWAIGTGQSAHPEDLREIYAALETFAGAGTRLLYGGSVKETNAADYLAVPKLDGLLVGGASLDAGQFLKISG